MKLILLLAMSVLVSSCGGHSNSEDSSLDNAQITSFSTEECYCCTSVHLEYQGSIYAVEEFPNVELNEEMLPYDVAVEINSYTGDCPNMNASAVYLD